MVEAGSRSHAPPGPHAQKLAFSCMILSGFNLFSCMRGKTGFSRALKLRSVAVKGYEFHYYWWQIRDKCIRQWNI